MNESTKTAEGNASASENSAPLDIEALLKKEDSDFISLQELLATIAVAGHATYQDAARLLLRRLQNTERDDRPSWCRLDINHGIVITGGDRDSFAWDCLRQAAQDGEPQVSQDDDIPF